MNKHEEIVQNLLDLTKKGNIHWESSEPRKIAEYTPSPKTITRVFCSRKGMWIVYLITYRIEEYYDVFEKFYETERNMILALDGRKVELAIYDNEVARTLMQNLDEEVRTAVGDRFIQEFRK